MSQTFPANTSSGTYLFASDDYISMQSANTNDNTRSNVDVDSNDVHLSSANTTANTQTSLTIKNENDRRYVYLRSENDEDNTISLINVANDPRGTNVHLSSEDMNANTESSLSVDSTSSIDLSVNDYDNKLESGMSVRARQDDSYATFQSKDDSSNVGSIMGITGKDNFSGLVSYEHDGTPDFVPYYPVRANVITWSSVIANNVSGKTTLGSENFATGVNSSVEASYADKNVNIDVINANAKTKSANYVINSDDFRHSFMFSRNDAPGANTRSSINANDKSRSCGMWAFQHDGTTEFSPSDEQLLSMTRVVANNALGSTLISSEDYKAGIVASVEASFIDKNIVLQVQDTKENSGTKLEMTRPGFSVKSTGNQLTDTLSSLEVSDEKQNIYMVAKDDTDGTRSTINVNNQDDNKRVFITARNDNTGTRSVIEASNHEEHVYLESSDNSIKLKSYLTVSRKHKNIQLFVEADGSATSFQVTNKEVTINGKRVLTQNDLDALNAPRPPRPRRRSIFGWFTGR